MTQEEARRKLDRAFRNEGLFFAALGLMALVILSLGGCGGALASPFEHCTTAVPCQDAAASQPRSVGP